jgi:hypothetical protein
MTPIETALEEHKAMVRRLENLEGNLKATLEREAILKGRIEQLDHELLDSKSKADHYLKWCSEIIRQMMNINMFVNDAMKEAKIEVEKGNGVRMKESLDAVEQAVAGAKHVAIQHQGER